MPGRAGVARGVDRGSSTPKDSWRLDPKGPEALSRPCLTGWGGPAEAQGRAGGGLAGRRRTSARAKRWPLRSIH